MWLIKKKFIDIHVGEPGSLHDYNVFKRSKLYKELSDLCHPNYYLLGDSAYTPSFNLISPFKDFGSLSTKEIMFNKELGKARVCVENAFALLKGRWRRLQHFENLKIELIINCIGACCVLHNIQIDTENEDEPDVDFIIQDNHTAFESIPLQNERENEIRRCQLLYELYK